MSIFARCPHSLPCQAGRLDSYDAVNANGRPLIETLAKAVRDAIEKNEPELGLDRLHTFVIKYVRTCCTRHGIRVTRDTPLHSIFGEYVRRLRMRGGSNPKWE